MGIGSMGGSWGSEGFLKYIHVAEVSIYPAAKPLDR